MIDYEELDPGIRVLVKELNDRGVITSDSGDGVSKPFDERVFHERHVVVLTTTDDMRACTQALSDFYPDAWVELSWSPGQVPNILMFPDGVVLPEGCGPG
jgi:hypothetical protein